MLERDRAGDGVAPERKRQGRQPGLPPCGAVWTPERRSSFRPRFCQWIPPGLALWRGVIPGGTAAAPVVARQSPERPDRDLLADQRQGGARLFLRLPDVDHGVGYVGAQRREGRFRQVGAVKRPALVDRRAGPFPDARQHGFWPWSHRLVPGRPPLRRRDVGRRSAVEWAATVRGPDFRRSLRPGREGGPAPSAAATLGAVPEPVRPRDSKAAGSRLRCSGYTPDSRLPSGR